MNKHLAALFNSLTILFTEPFSVFMMEQRGFVYLGRFLRLEASGLQK